MACNSGTGGGCGGHDCQGVGVGAGAEEPVIKILGTNKNKLCTECNDSVATIQKLRKFFCPPCWIHHCNFRFCKRIFEIGKPTKLSSQMYRDSQGHFVNSKENVLILFDGSLCSKALLALVRQAVITHAKVSTEEQDQQQQNRSRNLPFPFTFTILFIYEGIDETGEVDGDKSNQENHIKYLENWLKESKENFSLHFPIVVSSLEMSLSSSTSSFQSSSSNTDKNKFEIENQSLENRKFREIKENRLDFMLHDNLFPLNLDLLIQLSQLVRNLKTKTSQLDFLQCLRQNLIISIIHELQLSKVQKILVPEDQTSLAVKMFSIMALGRGAQLAEQMNLTTSIEGVELGRTMIDLSSDDLRDYLDSLDILEKDAIDKKKDKRKYDNIKRQCEEFIVTLQRDYPSTVPTLTKIGAKLQPTATTTTATHNNLSLSIQPKKCKLCKRLVQDQLGTIDLCYGCKSIFSETKDPDLFTKYILHV